MYTDFCWLTNRTFCWLTNRTFCWLTNRTFCRFHINKMLKLSDFFSISNCTLIINFMLRILMFIAVVYLPSVCKCVKRDFNVYCCGISTVCVYIYLLRVSV